MDIAAKAAPLPMRYIVFAIYFFLLLLMALFPPFYLSVSGSTTIVLGIPLPIFYWISNAILVGLGVWGLYLAEVRAGALPEEGERA